MSFWRERRLRYQLELAARNGHGARLEKNGAALLECLDGFFDTYRPVASLLHGDLWGGNWGADRDGEPVIFDPAVYYGDREADLARLSEAGARHGRKSAGGINLSITNDLFLRRNTSRPAAKTV